MKRLICVLFAVIFTLCSCHSGTAPIPVDSSIPTPQTTAAFTDTVTAETEARTEETTPVSSVRYIRQYEIIDLSVQGFITRKYERNGMLYIQTAKMLDMDRNQYQFTLYCYDDTGTLLSTVSIDAPAGIPKDAYLYTLSDGRYLMSDGCLGISYPNGEETGALYLLDADGTLLRSVTVQSHIGPVYIDEKEDGSVQYAAVAADFFYVFDENLEVIRQVPSTRFQLLSGYYWFTTVAERADGQYLFGWDPNDLFLHDSESRVTNYQKLRLPSAYDRTVVFLNTCGDIYLISNHQIEKYDEKKDQPELLFDFMDSGIGVQSAHSHDILLLNDKTMVYSGVVSENGRTEERVRMVKVTTVQDTSETEIITIRHTSHLIRSWFEEMVMKFNRMQTKYQVRVLMPAGYIEPAEQQKLIEEDLLYGNDVDMVMVPYYKIISPYYDKNAFMDLMPHFGDRIADCITTAFGVNGSLYATPLSMFIDTFTAPSSVIDHALTWEDMYRLTDSLDDNTLLMTDGNNCIGRMRSNGIMAYFDKSAKTSSYHTDAFHTMVTYLETLPDYIDDHAGYVASGWDDDGVRYNTTNAMLARRLREGGVKLLGTPISNIEAIALLKLLYGDVDFNYCGFPDVGCSGAHISGIQNISILEQTDVPDGCLAFLDFLLSDGAQTDTLLTGAFLPVTEPALRQMFEQYRYVYYDRINVYEKLLHPSTEPLDLTAAGHTAALTDDFGIYHDTSYYHVVELTDADCEEFLAFLSDCRMRDTADDTVRSIVTEELSYWQNDARSLEETTKIIDSRVWIYLNE